MKNKLLISKLIKINFFEIFSFYKIFDFQQILDVLKLAEVLSVLLVLSLSLFLTTLLLLVLNAFRLNTLNNTIVFNIRKSNIIILLTF